LLIQGYRRTTALGRADDFLAMVGLAERGQHLPAELSGGEQQRVAIARALVQKPQLLLVDEPTGNLDTATAQSVHALIFEVARNTGATLLAVTHDPSLAAMFSHRFELVDGQLAA